jgi:hypothetical protein
MKSLKKFAGVGLITILAATCTFAGTITGSRNGTITGSSNGTITGSRNGTITGSRNGTITGSRNGTITGSRNGIIPTAADQRFRSNLQEELLYSLVLYLSLGW